MVFFKAKKDKGSGAILPPQALAEKMVKAWWTAESALEVPSADKKEDRQVFNSAVAQQVFSDLGIYKKVGNQGQSYQRICSAATTTQECGQLCDDDPAFAECIKKVSLTMDSWHAVQGAKLNWIWKDENEWKFKALLVERFFKPLGYKLEEDQNDFVEMLNLGQSSTSLEEIKHDPLEEIKHDPTKFSKVLEALQSLTKKSWSEVKKVAGLASVWGDHNGQNAWETAKVEQLFIQLGYKSTGSQDMFVKMLKLGFSWQDTKGNPTLVSKVLEALQVRMLMQSGHSVQIEKTMRKYVKLTFEKDEGTFTIPTESYDAIKKDVRPNNSPKVDFPKCLLDFYKNIEQTLTKLPLSGELDLHEWSKILATMA
jgi:hypothetical protein